MASPEPIIGKWHDDLDPHGGESRDAAVSDVVPRLEKYGVTLDGSETTDDLADLLTAVEEFQATVAAHGGDSMLNDTTERESENPSFVLPRREEGERIGQYIWRITEAQRRIGRAD
ncbi:MAG: hypothetical protein NVS1B4_03750 [Gemmatimonadaceae bacterium]